MHAHTIYVYIYVHICIYSVSAMFKNTFETNLIMKSVGFFSYFCCKYVSIQYCV